MSQMAFPLRVLVIGGGLGGLCLTQALHEAGISVDVYERDDSSATRAQGYRVHIDTRGERALRECLPPSLYELFLTARGQESKGLTMFSVVDGQLKEAATRRFPESNNEFITVRAYFADGTSVTGDVLIAADGVGSRIREQFLPYAEVIDTGMRWLGGKTVLTNELRALLPIQLVETFGSVPTGVGQSMVFGLVAFQQDPNQAADRLWPGLRFHNTVDYIFWGVLVQQRQLAVSDDELNALVGQDLQRLVLTLGANWPQALRTLIEQCRSDQTFVLKMRHAKLIEHWQTTNITLLGDAIHVMLPNGSGAKTALRDASLLSRCLIAVAGLGTSLHQALHDYEIEMLRYGFKAVQASLQRGRAWQPFQADRLEQQVDCEN